MKQKNHCISPQKYFPSTKTQEIGRFDGAGIGFGERLKKSSSGKILFNLLELNVPGVGSYNLPSIFDKKKRTKPPLN